jgi:hypothetical protein
MRIQSGRMTVNAAESLAIEALSFLVENPESLARFLALTGLDPTDIRAMAHERAFLGAVLDYLAGDQGLLAAFAAHARSDPALVDRARILLTGGDWERDTA